MRNILIFLTIVFCRIIDLYTTKLAILDFSYQEQNLIVKLFDLDMKSFFILEIILAFILGFLYLYYKKNKRVFDFYENSFQSYVIFFFYDKKSIDFFDFLFKIKIKKIILLIGAVIPIYVVVTSLIFSLNNIWVYCYQEGAEVAIKYYDLLSEFYFFDFVIFVFPPIFLIYLLYRKLNNAYLKYNLQDLNSDNSFTII